jgi:hypothetical protein
MIMIDSVHVKRYFLVGCIYTNFWSIQSWQCSTGPAVTLGAAQMTLAPAGVTIHCRCEDLPGVEHPTKVHIGLQGTSTVVWVFEVVLRESLA